MRSRVPQQVSDRPKARPRQFTTFTIDEDEYGVDILAVREIKGWTGTRHLPDSPAHMRGVINLRGLIVPIFDLRARFTGVATETGRTHVVIIVTVDTRIIGILVDTVQDILTVQEHDIQPVPRTGGMIDNAYIEGIVMLDERMVSLLTLGRLFDLDGLPEQPARP